MNSVIKFEFDLNLIYKCTSVTEILQFRLHILKITVELCQQTDSMCDYFSKAKYKVFVELKTGSPQFEFTQMLPTGGECERSSVDSGRRGV